MPSGKLAGPGAPSASQGAHGSRVPSGKLGAMAPQFTKDGDKALSWVVQAEAAGLDGVFVYDHVWPMGRPDLPAIWAFTLLGAFASATSEVWLGPLVARVGLVPDEVLVCEMRTIASLAPGRLVAALGTGDSKSAAELEAFGVPFEPARLRRERLRSIAIRLLEEGLVDSERLWVGAGAVETNEVARALGGMLNLWEVPPDRVSELSEEWGGRLTWGGSLGIKHGPEQVARKLGDLWGAGASWVVCSDAGSSKGLAVLGESLEFLGGER
jgi:alkanesulfonate monooxygenase SsuD/methylene tetrahydromethanopterin reductase-like flavin-dependent oxidoreductase (luciferase family)